MTWSRLILLWTTLLALALAPASATARASVIAKTHVGVIDVAAALCIEAACSASLGEYRENPLAEYDGTSDVPHAAGGGATSVKVLGRQVDTAVAKNWPGHEVLDIANWTLRKNDAWVASGIKTGQNFYLASPKAGNLIQSSGPFKGQPTVFARELKQLAEAGYKRVGDYMVHPSHRTTITH